MPDLQVKRAYPLEEHGIRNTGDIYWNASVSQLYEEAVKRGEGTICKDGPIVVRTGQHTGRSPNDKFTVKESDSGDKIWWGDVNRSFDEGKFNAIKAKMLAYVQGRDLFVQDCHAGADAGYLLPIRVVNEYAWHSLFARNLFIDQDEEHAREHRPEFTIIDMPRFQAVPEIDTTNSETFILVNFSQKLVLIGGSSYGGEMKKSVFTILNFLLPQKNVMSMHCSANIGPKGDCALFFGLSGTGKTTLSADPTRTLIGDDEHGWSDDGVFNFEGGCYAKTIKLSQEAEPEIYQTTKMFGTVLENVIMDPYSRSLDLDDDTLTENTRAAYPITHIPNATPDGVGGHPKNIIFLTADAFGVMPPIAKITPDQAMYHFLSGYTAKVAGTERGIIEPEATFSTCFGAPFMALHPSVYAKLLGEKIEQHDVTCWLVNTGWTGGPYGVGDRMSISYTRAMIEAALSGQLDVVDTVQDPIFQVYIPASVPGVPDDVLQPKNTWEDGAAYDDQAKKLAALFTENFKQYADEVTETVRSAGPKVD